MPARTPAPIVATLHRHITNVLRQPDVVAALATNGADVVASTPEAFAAHIDAEITRWGKVVRSAGIRPD